MINCRLINYAQSELVGISKAKAKALFFLCVCVGGCAFFIFTVLFPMYFS